MGSSSEVLGHPLARRAAIAVLVALAAAVVLATLSGSGTESATGRLGGDFPEYYASGRMILDGQAHQLYDVDAQTAAQEPYIGADGGLLFFGYPPAVAALYVPLALVPYRISYLLHTALMVGAVLVGLKLLRPLIAPLRHAPWPTTALALTFAPLLAGVALGQNTGLSLLLIALSWRLAHDDRDLAAGVALGLLLFKPQMAVLLIALHLVAGRWRVVAGAAVTGAGIWLASAAVMGPAWVSTWIRGLESFGEIDQASNGRNTVSIKPMVEAMVGGSTASTAFALAASSAIVVGLAFLWRRGAGRDLTALMAITVPALLLVSPHALWYDAGLIVVTGAVVLARSPRALGPVLAVWALGLTNGLADTVGTTPVIIAVIVAALAALRLSPQPPSSDPPGSEPVQVGLLDAARAPAPIGT